jgi:hypothetical protein
VECAHVASGGGGCGCGCDCSDGGDGGGCDGGGAGAGAGGAGAGAGGGGSSGGGDAIPREEVAVVSLHDVVKAFCNLAEVTDTRARDRQDSTYAPAESCGS